MPNAAQYEDKLEAYTEGKDPHAMQADAPRILAELIEGVPEPALRQRLLPDNSSENAPIGPPRLGRAKSTDRSNALNSSLRRIRRTTTSFGTGSPG